jgi:hypothetical protein
MADVEKFADSEILDTWLRVDFHSVKMEIIGHLTNYSEQLKKAIFSFLCTAYVQ